MSYRDILRWYRATYGEQAEEAMAVTIEVLEKNTVYGFSRSKPYETKRFPITKPKDPL